MSNSRAQNASQQSLPDFLIFHELKLVMKSDNKSRIQVDRNGSEQMLACRLCSVFLMLQLDAQRSLKGLKWVKNYTVPQLAYIIAVAMAKDAWLILFLFLLHRNCLKNFNCQFFYDLEFPARHFLLWLVQENGELGLKAEKSSNFTVDINLLTNFNKTLDKFEIKKI